MLSLRLLVVFTATLLSACATGPARSDRAAVEHLLMLQKTRLEVAPLVARSKWNSHAPIDDPAREQVILEEVAGRARNIGLDASRTRRFFQDQFDAGKLVQTDLHRRWQLERLPPFPNPPDLARDVRPVLDRLTPELLTALVRLEDRWCDPQVMSALATLAPEILGRDYASAVREKAIEALRCQP